MKQKHLFVLWGALFILCALMGFIPEPAGAVAILMTGLALAFFAVGWLLLYRAKKSGDLFSLTLIRNLSAFSLGLTLLLLIANFLSVAASEIMGNIVHSILVIVASPMVCSGYWALSLFLWACLLIGAIQVLKKAKNA